MYTILLCTMVAVDEWKKKYLHSIFYLDDRSHAGSTAQTSDIELKSIYIAYEMFSENRLWRVGKNFWSTMGPSFLPNR